MRSASDILAEARIMGAQLTDNEASVVLASEDTFPRAWLGYQSDGTPAAYFENGQESEVSFSVSQVISVHGTLVKTDLTRGLAIPAVKVTCHDQKLDQVFYAFIDEVRERISLGADALEVIEASASEWRSLLQVATTPLTGNAAAGIFGELRFLEAAVIELGANAVEIWQRSPQEIHDFIGSHARVEVKSSTFQTRSAVTIHGLRQLEPPGTGTLTLAVAEIQKHGSESIDDVVARLRERGVSSAILTEKLRDSGYVTGMPGSESLAFDLLSWRFWEVTSDSVVLNRSALAVEIADAVSSLSYLLSLSVLGASAEAFDFQRFNGNGTGAS
ncbi:PD-(D/E)XK motif protein [Microbacterium sp. A82]|uniref:PD-(D/E)XK motif protein n=1 Tax=Microbacterium sp. A82 TaxID=3450452 RepID=UPI003F2EF98F